MASHRPRQIILVRHGQSRHHVDGLTGGWTDTALTELGLDQARLTARYVQSLVGTRPVRLLSSDLLRAQQTAKCLAESLPARPEFFPPLRELNNGAAAGLTQDQASSLCLPTTHPTVDWVPYPGAESWRSMERRIWGFLDQFLTADPEQVVLVTHGNAGIVIIQWWLQLGDCCRRGTSFELNPASVTVLTTNRWGERTLAKLNDTSHLTVSPHASR